MRRAKPNELAERAFPVMTAGLSEAELGNLDPSSFLISLFREIPMPREEGDHLLAAHGGDPSRKSSMDSPPSR